MSSDWPTQPLEECLDALIDYRGKTPTKTSAGIPLVTAKVIKGGRIEAPTEFISADEYDVWMRRGIPLPGDVVLTTEAPLGEVAQLGANKIALAQRVITLRGKAGLLDSTYLLYLLQTEEMQSQLKSRATGTTVLGIKQSELRKISVQLPPIEQQLEVGAVLSALDKRIDVIHATNMTLEAIAQTLFKSWFIDFDPVHAKADGREPEGLDADTAALFPDGFEESELGLVPRGWSITHLSDVLTAKNERVGHLDVPEYSSTNEGLFPRANLFNKKLSTSSAKNKIVRKGDLVFGLSRKVLNFGQMKEAIGSVSSAYKVYEVDAERIVPEFMGRLITTRAEYFFNAVSASSREGQSISSEALDSLVFSEPPKTVQLQLFDIVRSLEARSYALCRQVEYLGGMRELMLPRLISGQLRIPEAEAMLANAA